MKKTTIGQYIYKHQAAILERLFPEKTMTQIRRIIGKYTTGEKT